MANDLLKILKELRGTGLAEAPYTDGIYYDIAQKTTDDNGDVRLGAGMYGAMQAMHVDTQTVAGSIGSITNVNDNIDSIITVVNINTAISSLAADKVTLDSIYADKATLDSINNDKVALDSIYADKATLDSLYADKVVLDSLFTDKAILDSLQADKATLDSLYADKAVLDSIYADKATYDRLLLSIDSIDRLALSANNIDTIAPNAASLDYIVPYLPDIENVSDNIDDVYNYASTYYGAKAVVPTIRNDGTAMEVGDMYFDTTLGFNRTYNGTEWSASYAGDFYSTGDVDSKLALKFDKTGGVLEGSLTVFPELSGPGTVELIPNAVAESAYTYIYSSKWLVGAKTFNSNLMTIENYGGDINLIVPAGYSVNTVVDGVVDAIPSSTQTIDSGIKYVDSTTALNHKIYVDNGQLVLEEI